MTAPAELPSTEATSVAPDARETAAPQIGPFQVEATAIGPQSLVTGVAPITPRDRLAWRANAPMCPKKPQRPADHGLFDANARNQIEMFG